MMIGRLIQCGMLAATALALSAERASAITPESYQQPPTIIQSLVDAPNLPAPDLSPDGKFLLLCHYRDLPDIREIAGPERRLAGLRFDPNNWGRSRQRGACDELELFDSRDGRQLGRIKLGSKISSVQWSPTSRHFAFMLSEETTQSLWLADLSSSALRVRRLSPLPLNAVLSRSPFIWQPNGQGLIATVRQNQKPFQGEQKVSPLIQETIAEKAAVRTYQDLLKSPQDSREFAHYASSRLHHIKLDGSQTPLGIAGFIQELSFAPNGRYLLVEELKQPFSYLVPYYRFASTARIWDVNSKKFIVTVADKAASEAIPQGFDAVEEGPRRIQWDPSQPASLVWAEARDGGDPQKESQVRDELMRWNAPFAQFV